MPHIHRIEFDGAAEPDASLETNDTASSFWQADVRDCDTVYTGRIPVSMSGVFTSRVSMKASYGAL